MSSKKTIEINPELFMLSPSKKKNNVKRPNMKNLIKPNSLKRQLLNKMKEHSLKNRNKLDKDLQFHNEFKTHIDYLEKLGKRRTVKKSVNAHVELPDDLSQTEEVNVKEPPYGCLKAGDKPTFRQWKRITQKKITNNENENKAGDYQTASLIRLAVLEGAAFISIFNEEAPQINAVIIIAYFILIRPTFDKFTQVIGDN